MKKVFEWSILLVGICSLLLFGVWGIGRGSEYPSNFDMDYLFAAGRCWANGVSPYTLSTFLDVAEKNQTFPLVAAFAYPPQIGFLAYFLNLWPLWLARIWMTGINVLSVAALTYFCVKEFKTDLKYSVTAFLLAALIIGNPLTAHVVWMGQTSLIAASCLIGGWIFTYQSKSIWGGILIGISTIKPQLVILPLLWLLLDRQWKTLGIACVTIFFLSFIPMKVEGPIQVYLNWLEALKEYQFHPWGVIGFGHVFGLKSLLFSFGITLPDLLFLGLFLTFFLWLFRKSINHKNLLPIILAIDVLVIYAHDYDLVMLSPLFGSLFIIAEKSWVSSSAVFLLFFGLFFPQRVLKKLTVDSWLFHTREIFLLIALGWIIISSIEVGVDKENDLL